MSAEARGPEFQCLEPIEKARRDLMTYSSRVDELGLGPGSCQLKSSFKREHISGEY